MKAHSTPGWLAEIREYWSEVTAKLADESGQPAGPAPETAFSMLPAKPGVVRSSQSKRDALRLMSEKAD